jgi:arsenate reductase
VAAPVRGYGNEGGRLSAGIAPAETALARTIASLTEIGIDDSAHVPHATDRGTGRRIHVVVAMKPGLNIPQVDGVAYETWDLPNPQGWEPTSIRPLRNHIDGLVAAPLYRVIAR